MSEKTPSLFQGFRTQCVIPIILKGTGEVNSKATDKQGAQIGRRTGS